MTDVAVVTGAGRGIGEAIARRLAKRGYGVVCTDVDVTAAESVAKQLGEEAQAAELDVRDPEQHRAVAALASSLGSLRVWVNNAGVLRSGPAWELPDDELRLVVETNLLGVMHGSRVAAAAMSVGDVLNLSSLSALGPVPGLSVYAATKAAVLNFTVSMQGELRAARSQVRMHALCPDAVDTAMVRERADEPGTNLIHSAVRILEADRMADEAMRLIGSRRVRRTLPRWRGVLLSSGQYAPGLGLSLVPAFVRLGEWQRQRRYGLRDPVAPTHGPSSELSVSRDRLRD